MPSAAPRRPFPFPRRDWTGVPTATAAFLPVALRTFRSVSARWEDDWRGPFGERARTSRTLSGACKGAVVGAPLPACEGQDGACRRGRCVHCRLRVALSRSGPRSSRRATSNRLCSSITKQRWGPTTAARSSSMEAMRLWI